MRMLTKIKSIIYSKYNKVLLFITFLNEYSVKDYQEWLLNDEKPIKSLFIEWLFNKVIPFILFGFMLTIGLMNTNFINRWILVSTSLWLLFKFVVVFKQGE